MSNPLITQENNERVKGFFLLLERSSAIMEKLFTSRKPIPYIKLGGKILYRSSDVEKLLEEGYRKAWK